MLLKKTEVGQLYEKNRARLAFANQNYKDDAIFVSTNTYELLDKCIDCHFSNLVLNPTSVVSDKPPIVELLDSLMVNIYGTINDTSLIYYINHDITIPSVLNKHYIVNVVNPLDDFNQLYHTHYENMYIKLIEIYIESQKMKLDVPSFLHTHYITLDQAEVADCVLVGTDLAFITIETIISYCKLSKNKTIFGYIPVYLVTNDYYTVSNDYIGYHGITTHRKANNTLREAMLGNRLIPFNDILINVHTIKSVLNHNLVALSIINVKPTIDIALINSVAYDNDVITVSMPWLNTDLISLITTHKLLTNKKFVIKRRLFNIILSRMLANDSNLDQELDYARTLASTDSINTKGMYSLYNLPLDSLLDTVYLCDYIKNNTYSTIKYVSMLLNVVNSNVLLSSLGSDLFQLILQVLAKISNEVHTFLTHNDFLKQTAQLCVGLTYRQIVESSHNLDVLINPKDDQWLIYMDYKFTIIDNDNNIVDTKTIIKPIFIDKPISEEVVKKDTLEITENYVIAEHSEPVHKEESHSPSDGDQVIKDNHMANDNVDSDQNNDELFVEAKCDSTQFATLEQSIAQPITTVQPIVEGNVVFKINNLCNIPEQAVQSFVNKYNWIVPTECNIERYENKIKLTVIDIKTRDALAQINCIPPITQISITNDKFSTIKNHQMNMVNCELINTHIPETNLVIKVIDSAKLDIIIILLGLTTELPFLFNLFNNLRNTSVRYIIYTLFDFFTNIDSDLYNHIKRFSYKQAQWFTLYKAYMIDTTIINKEYNLWCNRLLYEVKCTHLNYKCIYVPCTMAFDLPELLINVDFYDINNIPTYSKLLTDNWLCNTGTLNIHKVPTSKILSISPLHMNANLYNVTHSIQTAFNTTLWLKDTRIHVIINMLSLFNDGFINLQQLNLFSQVNFVFLIIIPYELCVLKVNDISHIVYTDFKNNVYPALSIDFDHLPDNTTIITDYDHYCIEACLLHNIHLYTCIDPVHDSQLLTHLDAHVKNQSIQVNIYFEVICDNIHKNKNIQNILINDNNFDIYKCLFNHITSNTQTILQLYELKDVVSHKLVNTSLIYSKGQAIRTKFDCGTYSAIVNEFKILYDPNNTTTCVYDCLSFVVGHPLENVDMQHKIYTHYDLIGLCWKFNLNLIVCTPSHDLCVYVSLPYSPYITILLKKDIENYHATVIELGAISNITEQCMITDSLEIVYSDAIEYLTSTYHLSHNSILSLLQDLGSIHSNQDAKKVIDLLSRLDLASLQYLINSNSIVVIHSPINGTNKKYRLQHTNSAPLDTLCLICCTSNWIVGYLLTVNSITYLFTTSKLSNYSGFIISLRMKLFVNTRPAKMIKKNLRSVCLNNITKQAAAKIGIICDCDPLATLVDVLYIHYFDNRKHHEKDTIHEFAQFLSAQDIVLISSNLPLSPLLRSKILGSHNKCVNRLVILNGLLKYVVEFTNIAEAHLFASIIIKQNRQPCSIQGTCLHTTEPILTAINNCLIKKFNSKDHSLVNKSSIHNGNIAGTYADLKRIFTEDMSKFCECLNINNDKHSEQMYALSFIKATTEKLAIDESVSYDLIDDWYPVTYATNHGVYEVGTGMICCKIMTASGQTKLFKHIMSPDYIINKIELDPELKFLPKKQQGAIVPITYSVDALNHIQSHPFDNILMLTDIYKVSVLYLPYLTPYNIKYTTDDWTYFKPLVPSSIIDLWDNTDLSFWLDVNTPATDKDVIVTRENPLRLQYTTKYSHTCYPNDSRPVLDDVCYQELRAIISRQLGMIHIRTTKPSISETIRLMQLIYFREDASIFLEKCRNNLLHFDALKTKKWLECHENSNMKYGLLLKRLGSDMFINQLNEIKAHVKKESLLKDDPVMDWTKLIGRSIMWQSYAVAALFSPIFIEVKERMKQLLNERTVYTDGLRPDEINARLQSVSSDCIFMENDLVKQDRQTDENILDVEFEIYRLLGVSDAVLTHWRSIHYNTWMFKGKQCKGVSIYKRLTGQASTSIGNLITNMQTHCRFLYRNKNSLMFSMFLGDDSLFVFKQSPNITNLAKEIGSMFNMQSTSLINKDVASFCQLCIHKNQIGTLAAGPDFIRLRHRFEVLNNCKIDEETMNTRIMSYCMMIGPIQPVLDLITQKKYVIEPIVWYDEVSLYKALCIKYGCSEWTIRNQLNILISYMKNDQLIEHKFLHWVSSHVKENPSLTI